MNRRGTSRIARTVAVIRHWLCRIPRGNAAAARQRGGGCAVRVWLPLMAVAILLPYPRQEARSEAPTLSDAAAMAALVYQFGKFTEWPGEALANATGMFRICSAGEENALPQALATLEGKSIRGLSIRVHRLSRREEPSGCHVLVVADGQRPVGEWLRMVQNLPVLTVGDGENFAESGGMIGFVMVGDKLRFDINVEALRAARLNLSFQVMRLARNVKDRMERP